MVQAHYQYAIDVMLTRLRMIDADLTGKNERPLIRNLCSRIKTTESIAKKLERKNRKVTFETAVNTLNDIAGVRVVCYFADDIYQIADAVRRQKDLAIIKEKNYIEKPKKSGYQSLHLIVGVPVTYLDKTTTVRVEIQIRSVAMDYWAELDSQMLQKGCREVRSGRKSDEGICRRDRRCGSEDAGAPQEDTENVRVSGNPKRKTYIK